MAPVLHADHSFRHLHLLEVGALPAGTTSLDLRGNDLATFTSLTPLRGLPLSRLWLQSATLSGATMSVSDANPVCSAPPPAYFAFLFAALPHLVQLDGVSVDAWRRFLGTATPSPATPMRRAERGRAQAPSGAGGGGSVWIEEEGALLSSPGETWKADKRRASPQPLATAVDAATSGAATAATTTATTANDTSHLLEALNAARAELATRPTPGLVAALRLQLAAAEAAPPTGQQARADEASEWRAAAESAAVEKRALAAARDAAVSDAAALLFDLQRATEGLARERAAREAAEAGASHHRGRAEALVRERDSATARANAAEEECASLRASLEGERVLIATLRSSQQRVTADLQSAKDALLAAREAHTAELAAAASDYSASVEHATQAAEAEVSRLTEEANTKLARARDALRNHVARAAAAEADAEEAVAEAAAANARADQAAALAAELNAELEAQVAATAAAEARAAAATTAAATATAAGSSAADDRDRGEALLRRQLHDAREAATASQGREAVLQERVEAAVRSARRSDEAADAAATDAAALRSTVASLRAELATKEPPRVAGGCACGGAAALAALRAQLERMERVAERHRMGIDKLRVAAGVR